MAGSWGITSPLFLYLSVCLVSVSLSLSLSVSVSLSLIAVDLCVCEFVVRGTAFRACVVVYRLFGAA